jgi:glutaredoxin
MTEEADETAAAEDEKPRVTLYMTSWCGYCRKARRLLDSLEVPYEAKDIEESEEAAREYRKKAGSYRGIPVLDVDGRIVKGYQAELIHELVTRLKRQE